ncbi:MAG: amidohydrolase [Gammaproteobacteria bacterium]|nr:amidohydrolase [Gammaproteobacteria bacterium]
MTRIPTTFLIAVLCAAGCAPPDVESTVASPPDIILLNAQVVTMRPGDSIAEAVAVTGHSITAVGASAELRALAGPETEIIDMGGNTVTPGIIDTHNHFAWGALGEYAAVDIEYPAVSSIGDIRNKIRALVASLEPGEWIVSSNWEAAKLEEQRDMVAADLDDVSPENPVWLLHTSAHYGVANSAALEAAGITSATPDPDGGVIGRDDEGNPNGILADQAMSLVTSMTPPVTSEDFVQALSAAVTDLSAEGITAIKDPEIDQRHWDAYEAVAENGDLTVRVMTLWRVPDTMAEARDLLEHIAPITKPTEQDADTLVVSGGVKIYIDGSGTARTAWMHDDWSIDYTDTDEGNTGLTYLEPDLLFDQVRLFHDAGIHIGTHAIGDRAIDFTMDSYARVLDDNPTTGLRHSIIHSNLPTEHAMELMVRLQSEYDAGIPEVQPAFLWWIGDAYVANFGVDRSLRVLPLRTFEERGIRWAGASDYDVSPYAPRHAFWAASARETMLGKYGDNPWGTDESVAIHDTIRAYTASAARQLFLEDKVGMIEVGKRADIVAWDRDLYSIPVDELKEVRAVITLMNGDVVFRAAK